MVVIASMYWGFDFIQFLEAGEMLLFTLKSTFKKNNNETDNQ
jgi:hypothetical protein